MKAHFDLKIGLARGKSIFIPSIKTLALNETSTVLFQETFWGFGSFINSYYLP